MACMVLSGAPNMCNVGGVMMMIKKTVVSSLVSELKVFNADIE